ncbi:MAG: hypothetical protein AAFU03_08435, partial [Bacteroidota bacterium]
YVLALINAPILAKLRPNHSSFAPHFNRKSRVVVFPSIRGDAQFIVPNPLVVKGKYMSLADFVRQAPSPAIDDFWATVGKETLNLLETRPVYLNTHGLSVSWLHVRLDTYPKYYSYDRFRSG